MLKCRHLLCTAILIASAADGASAAPGSADTATGQVLGPFPLYDGAIPNSKPAPDREARTEWSKGQWHDMEILYRVSHPTYTAYLPPEKQATGAAVLVFPGGGYSMLGWDSEGRWIVSALQQHGIAGVLVKYRMPSAETMLDKPIGPLQDAQQAMIQVRRHAADWHIDPNKVGAIGFSAGGHLASLLGTTFETTLVPNPDNASVRPDFLILVYPITSFAEGRVNPAVRNALLGTNPSPDLLEKFSTTLQVTKRTPPTLLLGASNDSAVDYDHLIEFYRALRKHDVPAELVLFDRGEHGLFDLTQNEWRTPIWSWLGRNGWTKR